MTMLRTFLVAALFSSLTGTSLLAEDNDNYSTTYNACMNDAVSTYDMLSCLGAELEYQDGLLNKNYQTLMKAASEERKTQVREAQRHWIKLRDANCDQILMVYDGTSADISYNSCLTDMTTLRAKELRDLIDLDDD